MDSFDDFYDPQIKRRNVAAVLGNRNFALVEGDIRDEAAVRRALGPAVDAVVHVAARAGVRPSIEQPLLYTDRQTASRAFEALSRLAIIKERGYSIQLIGSIAGALFSPVSRPHADEIHQAR